MTFTDIRLLEWNTCCEMQKRPKNKKKKECSITSECDGLSALNCTLENKAVGGEWKCLQGDIGDQFSAVPLMVKDKENSSTANFSSAVRMNYALEPVKAQEDGGSRLWAILPGNGLPVALHSSSVGKPDRMVWLMISPEWGILGGSEGHTKYYTLEQQFILSSFCLLSPPSPLTHKVSIYDTNQAISETRD